MKNSNNILKLFVLASVIHIIGLLLNYENLATVTKPLIMIMLLLFYLAKSNVRSNLYVGAVIFSLIGDVLLISNSELNFILGLVSFLMAHILYIIIVTKDLESSSLTDIVSSMFPFIIMAFSLLYLLKDSLGEMKIPVVVYAFVISVFGAVSLLNYLNKKSLRAQLLLVGAILFILSDSVLAINKFYVSSYVSEVVVMISYISAQYFICSYMIKLDNKVEV